MVRHIGGICGHPPQQVSVNQGSECDGENVNETASWGPRQRVLFKVGTKGVFIVDFNVNRSNLWLGWMS